MARSSQTLIAVLGALSIEPMTASESFGQIRPTRRLSGVGLYINVLWGRGRGG